MDTTGIIESCSNGKYMALFLCSHFEHFCIQRSILFSIVFIKQIFFTFIDFSTLIFQCASVTANMQILKATARQRENSFSFGMLFLLTLRSSNWKGSYAIALKFSVKQINLIRKKIVSAILQNNKFLWTLVIAYFSKNTKAKIKLKPIFFFFFFWRSPIYFCRECYDLDMCQNSDKNMNV